MWISHCANGVSKLGEIREIKGNLEYLGVQSELGKIRESQRKLRQEDTLRPYYSNTYINISSPLISKLNPYMNSLFDISNLHSIY